MKVFVKFFNSSKKTEIDLDDECTVGDLWMAYKDTGNDAHRLICKGKILCTVADPENPTSENWDKKASFEGVSDTCTIIAMERQKKKTTSATPPQETTSAPAPAPAPPVMPGTTGTIPGMPPGSENIMALFEQTIGFDIQKALSYIQNPDNDEYATYVLNNPTLNNVLRENSVKDPSLARLKELNNDFFEILMKDKIFMKQFAVTYVSKYIQTKLGTLIQQSGLPPAALGMQGFPNLSGGQGNLGGGHTITLTPEENVSVEELMESHSLSKEEVAIAFKGLSSNKEKTDECLTKAKNLSSALGCPTIDCIDALLATNLNEEMAGGILFG